ncbi:MAG: hypothetical protein ACRDP5_17695 [Streptosporangiaceae bacterium]
MTTPATPVTVAPALSIATDKAVYNTGDPITVTAAYSDQTTQPVTLTVTASATDPSGTTVEATATATVNTQAQQPMQIGISDSFGDSFTQQSNAAGSAVFTATIGTPPAS